MLIDPLEHFRRDKVALRQMPPLLVDEFDRLDHCLQDCRLRKPCTVRMLSIAVLLAP